MMGVNFTMKRIVTCICCFIVGMALLCAETTSAVQKGKLPAGKKIGPVLWEYLQEVNPAVKDYKAVFKTLDSINEQYLVEARCIFLEHDVEMEKELEFAIIGKGSSFSIQLQKSVMYVAEEKGWGQKFFSSRKSMNTHCKNVVSEIEALASKMSDSEYEAARYAMDIERTSSGKVISAAHENILKAEDFLIAYWKLSKKNLSRSDYLNFLKACKNDVYRKYHDDEFELENRIDEVKAEVDNRIANFDTSKRYKVYYTMEFGKYNFEEGGYPVELEEGTFFILKQEHSIEVEKMSDANRQIAIEPVNYAAYNFIPIDRKNAQTLLESRKSNISGNVNRTIDTIIAFRFLDLDSTEAKNFSKFWKEIGTKKKTEELPIPMVITVDAIQAFTSLDERNPFNIDYIGEIVQK